MTYEEWADIYRPKINHLDGSRSDLFETYGIEIGYVLGIAETEPDRVWTLVDGDIGTYIVNGYRLVNRIGYFITEVPFTGDFIEVLDQEYGEDDEDND